MLVEFEKYKNQQKKIEAMKAAIKRFREWGAIGDNERLFKKAANMEKRLEQMELIEKPVLERDKLPIGFNTGGRSGKRVLTVKGFDFSYGDKFIFKNADLEVCYGDRVCLLGDNGSGKSTIIKVIMGQLSPLNGKITMGESVKPGYIEQEVSFENEKDTVLEALKKDALIPEQEARRILARYCFIGDNVLKRLEVLSGGERVIIKLAMLMQREVNFLILDEPTNHLDIDTKELLEESLSEYKGTILFVSHDRYFINKLASRVVNIADYKLINYDGDYNYYLSRKK